MGLTAKHSTPSQKERKRRLALRVEVVVYYTASEQEQERPRGTLESGSGCDGCPVKGNGGLVKHRKYLHS